MRDACLSPASSGSSLPARSSACSSSQPPTCRSPMKICGTVMRAVRALDHFVAALPVAATVDLGEGHALAFQQRLGVGNRGNSGWCRFRRAAWCVRLRFAAPFIWGLRSGLDNPGEHQHIDMGGAGPQQRAGAGIDGGAGGQHVVDQHQPAAGDIGLFLRRHAEGALHIVGALAPSTGRPAAAWRARA